MAREYAGGHTVEDLMDWIFNLSFDHLAMSFLTVFAIRETLILLLPDEIAGPGGWFIDTGCEACQD